LEVESKTFRKNNNITAMEGANKLFNEQVSISKQLETKICIYFRIISYVFASTAPNLFIAQYLIKQFNFTVLYLHLKLQNLKIQRDVKLHFFLENRDIRLHYL
jgi:hypothetical protein